MPEAIHSVEALGEEPIITFNIYGETDFSQRFEFDTLTNTAKNFQTHIISISALVILAMIFLEIAIA